MTDQIQFLSFQKKPLGLQICQCAAQQQAVHVQPNAANLGPSAQPGVEAHIVIYLLCVFICFCISFGALFKLKLDCCQPVQHFNQ